MIAHRKTPFSQISHIDCTSIGFASGLRGGYGADESTFGISTKSDVLITPEVADIMEVEEKKKQQCDKPSCRRAFAQLVQLDLDV